jgi:hypothetical protein
MSLTGLDLEIIENPVIEKQSEPIFLKSGDNLELFCNSVEESDAIIIIHGITSVHNPAITNLRSNESVTYNGLLRKGAVLKISADGSGWLTGIDVSDRIVASTGRVVKIPKGRSEWQYTDSNAFFNSARFDQNALADFNAGMVEVRINWLEHLPAVVLIKVPEVNENDISRTEIEDLLEMVRPVGIKFLIEYSEV